MTQGITTPSYKEAAQYYAKSWLRKGYVFEALHEYQDINGQIIYCRIRLKHPNGDKWIRPLHRKTDGSYPLTEPDFGGKKPLFGLPFIAQNPQATIYVVEGEKCTDTLNAFFQQEGVFGQYVAITSGSATSAESADWSYLLGRNIVIFPDHNGIDYAIAVEQALQLLDCQIATIDTSNLALPEGGDIVDWLDQTKNASIDAFLNLPTIQYPPVIDGKVLNVTNDLGDPEIQRLAELPELEYDKVRKAVAKEKDVRVSILDKEVQKQRKASNARNISVLSPDPEPWEEPVVCHDILNEIEAILRRFCILPDYAYIVISLWICFTWCIDAAYTAPILALCSPEKRCGKTTLLSLLAMLVKRGLPASNITPAALFRTIEAFAPTLCIDEADSFLDASDELRGILNSGHTRGGAFVIRTVGDEHQPHHFNTFGAKVIAMIGKLPDTLEDRSIRITMRRKFSNEKVQRLRHHHQESYLVLQRKLLRLANDNVGTLEQMAVEELPFTSDRMADNVELLLAIATLAGSEWLNRAKKAFLVLAGEAAEAEETSIGIRLLADMKEIFQHHGDKIFSSALVAYLANDEEKPWQTYDRGQIITPRQIAAILSDFGIRSKSMRSDSDNAKGYELKQFIDAFERYLPSSAESSIVPEHINTDVICDAIDTQNEEVNNSSVTLQAAATLGCDVVTAKNTNIDEAEVESMMMHYGNAAKEEAG